MNGGFQPRDMMKGRKSLCMMVSESDQVGEVHGRFIVQYDYPASEEEKVRICTDTLLREVRRAREPLKSEPDGQEKEATETFMELEEPWGAVFDDIGCRINTDVHVISPDIADSLPKPFSDMEVVKDYEGFKRWIYEEWKPSMYYCTPEHREESMKRKSILGRVHAVDSEGRESREQCLFRYYYYPSEGTAHADPDDIFRGRTDAVPAYSDPANLELWNDVRAMLDEKGMKVHWMTAWDKHRMRRILRLSPGLKDLAERDPAGVLLFMHGMGDGE